MNASVIDAAPSLLVEAVEENLLGHVAFLQERLPGMTVKRRGGQEAAAGKRAGRSRVSNTMICHRLRDTAGALVLLGMTPITGATTQCPPGTESSISLPEWAFLFLIPVVAIAVPFGLLRKLKLSYRKTVGWLGLLLAIALGATLACLGFFVWVNYMLLPCDTIAAEFSGPELKANAVYRAHFDA